MTRIPLVRERKQLRDKRKHTKKQEYLELVKQGLRHDNPGITFTPIEDTDADVPPCLRGKMWYWFRIGGCSRD